MPLFNYACSNCNFIKRSLKSDPPTCPACNIHMVRKLEGPTTKILETLDNGIMTKKVERLSDAERIFKERHEADQRRQNGEGE